MDPLVSFHRLNVAAGASHVTFMVDAVAPMRAAEAELEGWLYVTNQLLLDNAQSILTQVDEPSLRSAVVAEYVLGLTSLLDTHVAAVTSLVSASSRESAAAAAMVESAAKRAEELENRRANDIERDVAEMQNLATQKEALERGVIELREEADRLRSVVDYLQSRADIPKEEAAQAQEAFEVPLQEKQRELGQRWEGHKQHMKKARVELDRLRRECAVEEWQLQEVRHQLQLLANMLAELRGDEEEEKEEYDRRVHEEPGECLRRLLGEVVEYAQTAQRRQQELQDEVMMLREKVAAQEQQLIRNEVTALYQRVAPPPAVSPVALTLQSVREQVRDLRPHVAKTPSGVVHTPRVQKQDQEYLYSHLMGDTPCALTPAPHCKTSEGRALDGVPPTVFAWRERMALLKAELRDLRREIGS